MENDEAISDAADSFLAEENGDVDTNVSASRRRGKFVRLTDWI